MNEQEWRVIELYLEDGLKEVEIAELEGISIDEVHAILHAYETGDIHEEAI